MWSHAGNMIDSARPKATSYAYTMVMLQNGQSDRGRILEQEAADARRATLGLSPFFPE